MTAVESLWNYRESYSLSGTGIWHRTEGHHGTDVFEPQCVSENDS